MLARDESNRHACSPKYPSRAGVHPSRVGSNIRLAWVRLVAPIRSSFVRRRSSHQAARVDPEPPASRRAASKSPYEVSRAVDPRPRDGRNPRPRDGRNLRPRRRPRRTDFSRDSRGCGAPPSRTRLRWIRIVGSSVAGPSPTVPSSRSSSNRNDSRRRRRRGAVCRLRIRRGVSASPRAPTSSPPRAAPSPGRTTRTSPRREDTTRVSTRATFPRNPIPRRRRRRRRQSWRRRRRRRPSPPRFRLSVSARALHRASRVVPSRRVSDAPQKPPESARTRARARDGNLFSGDGNLFSGDGNHFSGEGHLFSGDGHLFSTSKSPPRARAASGAGANLARARRARENIFPAMPRRRPRGTRVRSYRVRFGRERVRARVFAVESHGVHPDPRGEESRAVEGEHEVATGESHRARAQMFAADELGPTLSEDDARARADA